MFLLQLCLDQKVETNPHARNLIIFDRFISWYKSKYYTGKLLFKNGLKPYCMQEREMKQHVAAFLMMKQEYIKLGGDRSSGIAVLNFAFDVKNKHVSVVILFHNGQVQIINIRKLIIMLSVYFR